jgi:hypothetical protein
MNFRHKPIPEVPAVDPELERARHMCVSLVLALQTRSAEVSELRAQLATNTASLDALRAQVAALPGKFDSKLATDAMTMTRDSGVQVGIMQQQLAALGHPEVLVELAGKLAADGLLADMNINQTEEVANASS